MEAYDMPGLEDIIPQAAYYLIQKFPNFLGSQVTQWFIHSSFRTKQIPISSICLEIRSRQLNKYLCLDNLVAVWDYTYEL